MSTLEDNQEEQPELTTETLRNQQSVLQDLLNHEGWALLASYAATQIKFRSNEIVFTPISEQNARGQFEQEYRKGECSGIYTFMNMPQTIVEETQSQLKERQEAEDLNHEEDEDG